MGSNERLRHFDLGRNAQLQLSWLPAFAADSYDASDRNCRARSIAVLARFLLPANRPGRHRTQERTPSARCRTSRVDGRLPSRSLELRKLAVSQTRLVAMAFGVYLRRTTGAKISGSLRAQCYDTATMADRAFTQAEKKSDGEQGLHRTLLLKCVAWSWICRTKGALPQRRCGLLVA